MMNERIIDSRTSSSTVIKSTRGVIRPEREEKNRVLPILRLKVDEGGYVTEDDGMKHLIHFDGPMEQVIEHDQSVERNGGNPNGLMYGEKRAKDGSWFERWIQQSKNEQENNGNQEKFGRNCGYNMNTGERWTESWHENDHILTVEKEREKIDFETRTLSEKTMETYRRNELTGEWERHQASTKYSNAGDLSWTRHQGGNTIQGKETLKWERARKNIANGNVEQRGWIVDENDKRCEERLDLVKSDDILYLNITKQWNEGEKEYESCSVQWKDDITSEEPHNAVGYNIVKAEDIYNGIITTMESPPNYFDDIECDKTWIMIQNIPESKIILEKNLRNNGQKVHKTIMRSNQGDGRQIKEEICISHDNDHQAEHFSVIREITASNNGELTVERTEHDDWWIQPSSNRWGSKITIDHDENSTTYENWYDNGYEKQVDRWTVESDQRKHGIKFGSKTNGVSWEENWVEENGSKNITKQWKEYNHDGEQRWGEIINVNGTRLDSKKWGVNQLGGSIEKDWTLINRIDDEGNTVNCSETILRDINQNRETKEWSKNSYGTAKEELWAYNQGYNNSGDWWEEKWNEKPGKKTAMKTGRNASGDQWTEEWSGEHDDRGNIRWACKSGSNAMGDSWSESWHEVNETHKVANKKAANPLGETWQEMWGEENNPDGSGQKWCSKWTHLPDGNKRGENWGDKWGSGGKDAHQWGERWVNDHVEKWNNQFPFKRPYC